MGWSVLVSKFQILVMCHSHETVVKGAHLLGKIQNAKNPLNENRGDVVWIQLGDQDVHSWEELFNQLLR